MLNILFKSLHSNILNSNILFLSIFWKYLRKSEDQKEPDWVQGFWLREESEAL